MTEPYDLRPHIRNIPNFPIEGIMFRDITTLLANPRAFRACMDQLLEAVQEYPVDVVAAAESRGFIFGAPLALELGARFVPVRKPGKLPFTTHAFHYELEYGKDSLEMHTDAVSHGENVLLVDDLLATGGTVQACINLIEKGCAKVVACAFVVELSFLKGRSKLAPHPVISLVQYDSE